MAKPIIGIKASYQHNTGFPIGMIRWRVDQLHVGTSALSIAREFWHKRAKGHPRTIKRAAVRYALKCHQVNQRLYRDVMRGI